MATADDSTIETILAAVDGSEHACRALAFGAELAKRYGARVLVVGVYRHHSPLESTHSLVRGREEIESPDAALGRLARETVEQGLSDARAQGVGAVEGLVRRGPPARTIVAVAREHAVDVIVMGSRGLGDVEGVLLGSVSHKVSSLAECTVITVKPGFRAGTKRPAA